MRFAVLLAVLAGSAAPALAQVTIDLHALDAVPGVKPAVPEKARPRHVHRHTAKAPRAAPSGTPGSQQATSRPGGAPSAPAAGGGSSGSGTTATNSAPGAAPATPPVPQAPPPATLPTAVPPTVAIAPIAPPPPDVQAAPPPPPPISEAAASTATPRGSGLRVTFGSGQAELSPASAAAIRDLARAAAGSDSTSFNVVAFAAGTPDDPSTARRLSLSRALAVRSALIADGINSTRIYVRALGAATGDGPADRADLTVLGGNAPSAVPASAPGQGAPPKSQPPKGQPQ